MYLLLVGIGVAFFYAMMIALASTSVWFGRNQGLYDFWFYITSFARYPQGIFKTGTWGGDFIWFGFSFVLPILLVVTIPSRVLLAKTLDPNWWVGVIGPAATLVCAGRLAASLQVVTEQLPQRKQLTVWPRVEFAKRSTPPTLTRTCAPSYFSSSSSKSKSNSSSDRASSNSNSSLISLSGTSHSSETSCRPGLLVVVGVHHLARLIALPAVKHVARGARLELVQQFPGVVRVRIGIRNSRSTLVIVDFFEADHRVAGIVIVFLFGRFGLGGAFGTAEEHDQHRHRGGGEAAQQRDANNAIQHRPHLVGMAQERHHQQIRQERTRNGGHQGHQGGIGLRHGGFPNWDWNGR